MIECCGKTVKEEIASGTHKILQLSFEDMSSIPGRVSEVSVKMFDVKNKLF